ncbi:MAG: hypothetical protein ACXW2U_04845 [Telluria sp.]
MAGYDERFVERFTTEVEERLAPYAGRGTLAAAVREAFDATVVALDETPHGALTLPTARLGAAEVVARGLVAMSQATLYRAAEQKRFYTTTPRGKTIGRQFPAWQFVEPAPELIGSVLHRLATLPASQVHAFWITRCDEFNELCPAEVLAGKPFDTTASLQPSQQALLDQPARIRQRKIEEFARQHSVGMAGVIS